MKRSFVNAALTSAILVTSLFAVLYGFDRREQTLEAVYDSVQLNHSKAALLASLGLPVSVGSAATIQARIRKERRRLLFYCTA